MQPLSLLAPLGQTKIYLYAKHVDMRKSFDGLHALIQSEFKRDVRRGDLFLFLNRRLGGGRAAQAASLNYDLICSPPISPQNEGSD